MQTEIFEFIKTMGWKPYINDVFGMTSVKFSLSLSWLVSRDLVKTVNGVRVYAVKVRTSCQWFGRPVFKFARSLLAWFSAADKRSYQFYQLIGSGGRRWRVISSGMKAENFAIRRAVDSGLKRSYPGVLNDGGFTGMRALDARFSNLIDRVKCYRR